MGPYGLHPLLLSIMTDSIQGVLLGAAVAANGLPRTDGCGFRYPGAAHLFPTEGQLCPGVTRGDGKSQISPNFSERL